MPPRLVPLPEMEYPIGIAGISHFNSARLNSAKLVFEVLAIPDI